MIRERIVLLSIGESCEGLLHEVRRLDAPGRELIIAIDGASEQPGLAPLPERWGRVRSLLAPYPLCWATPLVRTRGLPTVADQCAALRARLGRFAALYTDSRPWYQCARQLGCAAELLPTRPSEASPAAGASRSRALVVMRAQPFHLGHRALVERALQLADEVIVVIAAAERAFSARDPFTAGERLSLVRAGLGELCARAWLVALPAPAWPAAALAELAFVVPGFSCAVAHNPILRALAAEQGLAVEGLARPLERGGSVLSATAIRARLAREGAGAWLREVMPEGAAELMGALPELGQRCALIAEGG